MEGKSMNDSIRTQKVGYIAVGNAGAQNGCVLKDKNPSIPVIAINTSSEDNKVIPTDIIAFTIGDHQQEGAGAAHNREISRHIFGLWDQQSRLLDKEEFVKFLKECDIIFVCGSTGGGTGSGLVMPIAESIANKYDTKIIIPIGIGPRWSESKKVNKNSLEFFNDIQEVNSDPDSYYKYAFMAYDLDGGNSKELELSELYSAVASNITDDIDLIAGSMACYNGNQMIDTRELKMTLSQPGLLTVHTRKGIDTKTVSNSGGIQKLIIDDIKASFSMENQHDKISKYRAIYIEIPDELDDPIKHTDFSDLNNYFGEPDDTFINYTTVNRTTVSYGIIISGMSFPLDRLSLHSAEMHQYLKEQEKRDSRIYNIDGLDKLTIGSDVDTRKVLGLTGENKTSKPSRFTSKLGQK